MEIGTVLSTTTSFMVFAGDVLADLKRQEISRIDIDLLRLKRAELTEKFSDFQRELKTEVRREKARAEQDLVSRGLSGTTIRESTLRAIERDASDEIAKATREYNRTMEEIALMERKLVLQSRPWWRMLGRSIGLTTE